MVEFDPWVGKNYSKSKPKILVLGESHWGTNKDFPKNETTQRVMTDYLNYKKGEEVHEGWMNTFTKFYNLANEQLTNKLDVHAFWESVSFYNFIQDFIEAPRIHPQQKLFKDSLNAFSEVLESLKPEIVFIWGARLWNHLPWDIFVENEGDKDFYNLITSYGNVKTFWVYHPSSTRFGNSDVNKLASLKDYKCSK